MDRVVVTAMGPVTIMGMGMDMDMDMDMDTDTGTVIDKEEAAHHLKMIEKCISTLFAKDIDCSSNLVHHVYIATLFYSK